MEEKMEDWKTIFGKTPPEGFDFDMADRWEMETWNRLEEVDRNVAIRTAIVYEIMRRDMLRKDPEREWGMTPFTWMFLDKTDEDLIKDVVSWEKGVA
jgi:hypothetical protein